MNRQPSLCTQCGAELAGGLIATIEHDMVCKRDAPNSCIETHKWVVMCTPSASDIKKREEKERAFDLIFKEMTKSERQELMVLSLYGTTDFTNRITLVSTGQLDKIETYKERMRKNIQNNLHIIKLYLTFVSSKRATY